MKRPEQVHDVQKLTGYLAALSQFISRLGEKALPLYRLMKNADTFEWIPKQKQHLLSSKPCSPPSRCLLSRTTKRLCFCTLRLMAKSSAQSSRWSEKKKASPTKFNDQWITSLMS